MMWDQVLERFARPSPEYSPAPFWWWSGERLDRERLRWEMEQLIAGGVYNVVIIHLAGTGPYASSDADSPPFLSPEWWEIVKGVCEDARTLGMRLWFYDQIGFAGSNTKERLVADNPDFSGWSLQSVVREGTGILTALCPEEGEPLAASGIPLDREGNPAGDAVALPLKGRSVQASMPGYWRLRLMYVTRAGFDSLNPEACRLVFDTLHGELERRLPEYLGDTVVGTFQDELQAIPNWSADFAAEFRRRKGYDLLPRLHHLWEGDSPEACRARIDYHAVRAELAEERFFRPLFAWHDRNGLICGFDQMGGSRTGQPTDTVRMYADYLRTHRWFGAPGSDHHGEGKIHSSMAHLYERPRTWLEGFHSSGWGGTLEEIFDWLVPWLRAGANLFNPHAVYYSTKGGWWEWAPPSTCWRQPYWRHYRVFATAISRLSALLSTGAHVCDVAVLHPTTSAQAGCGLDRVYPAAIKAQSAYRALVGSMIWENPEPGVLDRDGRDFDVIDEASLQRGSFVDGKLCVSKEGYRAVVLPSCRVLENSSVTALCNFVENGGTLVAVGELPSLCTGDDHQDDPLKRLHNLFQTGKARQVAEPDDVPVALADIERLVTAPVPTLHRRVGKRQILFIPARYPRATRHASEGDRRFLPYSFDPQDYPASMRIRLRGKVHRLELWDSVTGERSPLSPRIGGDETEVDVPFDTGPAAVLVWTEDADSEGMSRVLAVVEPKLRQVMTLGDIWECALEPTMDNRFGDFAKPNGGIVSVQTWFFQHRVERPDQDGLREKWYADHDGSDWNEVQATYGVYGWWKGPIAAELLPAPLTATLPGSDPLDSDGWQPVAYSLSRGIARDELHRYFGPRGHVPEEFLDFGTVAAGKGVQLRTTLWRSEPGLACLCIGAPAAKQLWVNGACYTETSPAYLWMPQVALRAGCNVIEFRLVAEDDVRLRAYWAVVRDPKRFARPEVVCTTDEPAKDTWVRIRKELALPFTPRAATIKITTDVESRLLVNARLVARHGGYSPWTDLTRTQSYTVDTLRMGENCIVVEARDPGRPVSLTADILVEGLDGREVRDTTGAGWRFVRPGTKPARCKVRRQQWEIRANTGVSVDPAWSHLTRRPHPLPETAWLNESATSDAVESVMPDAYAGSPRVEWFRWRLPPGAVRMHVPIDGAWRVWVNGAPAVTGGNDVELPNPKAVHRFAVARVIPERGRTHGAVFSGPVTYETRSGAMTLGDWNKQGLESYSGAVRYRSSFLLPADSFGRIELDLGRVRGTAEVWVNGQPVGTRIWSPYVLDITKAATPGANTVEILVCNTLAPYLKAAGPTPYVLPGQEVSGMFGPVRALLYR